MEISIATFHFCLQVYEGEVMYRSPPLILGGLHSKTLNGFLKPWNVSNYTYTMFFPVQI